MARELHTSPRPRQYPLPVREREIHDCAEYRFAGTGCVKCGMERWRETRPLHNLRRAVRR
jgi:hypothetical protein